MLPLQEILFSQGFGTRRVCCGLVQQGLVQVGPAMATPEAAINRAETTNDFMEHPFQ